MLSSRSTVYMPHLDSIRLERAFYLPSAILAVGMHFELRRLVLSTSAGAEEAVGAIDGDLVLASAICIPYLCRWEMAAVS